MNRNMITTIAIIATIILLAIGKIIWVRSATKNMGSFETEKIDIMQRRDFLIEKINVNSEALINAMPSAVGRQFQGEWALYSLSMLTQSLANISQLYPETREENIRYTDSLIAIALTPEIRYYDAARWFEDPLESLDGDESHISYLSHVAWMIGNYKHLGGNDKYDALYNSLCETMNRRLLDSPNLNLPTYPNEPIYVPDMLVAIVALADYAQLNNGTYQSTVDQWIERAQKEWLDDQTGLLKSFLFNDGYPAIGHDLPLLGSYVSLNCYYLTLIDEKFAHSQYELMKKYFVQTSPVAGIKEYHDHRCWLGLSVDAGIILLNLAPSGTAFGVGSVTYFGDQELRSQFLRTAEMAGSTIVSNNKRHYWLANLALVGEAITLAMRTTIPYNNN